MTTFRDKMALNPMDPSVLTDFVERKGSLSLRSNHVSYGRATLNSNWNHSREAEPMDYDIRAKDAKWNLLRATYNRIGNATTGTLPETTTKEALKEAQELAEEFQTRTVHKTLVSGDNFEGTMTERDSETPKKGYGSILPRHKDDHLQRHLNTTHKSDYEYPFQWTPKEEEPANHTLETKHRHKMSEFTDTSGYRRRGCNTWQDSTGSLRAPSSVSSNSP